MARRPPPPPASRGRGVTAKRVLLRQMRSAGGVYSDGKSLLTGPALSARKRALVHDLVSSRAHGQPWPKMAGLSRKAATFARLRLENRNPAASLSDALASLIAEHARPGSPDGAPDVVTAARRLLRRLDPDRFAALARPLRLSRTEQDHIAAARAARPMETRMDIEDPETGWTVPAGTPVTVGPDGGYVVDVNDDEETLAVPAASVRRCRTPARSPEPDPFMEP